MDNWTAYWLGLIGVSLIWFIWETFPEQRLMRKWEREARESYTVDSLRSPERFQMEYVWNKICEYQNEEKNESS